jgi:hypothetical protein
MRFILLADGAVTTGEADVHETVEQRILRNEKILVQS